MNWNRTDSNGLYVSILLKNMVWYLFVKGILHNDDCLIYIFTGKVQNGTPSIFNKLIFKNCIKN